MSEGKVDEFMAITGADDAAIATQFIEMADGNLNTAISLFFENGGAALLSSNNTPTPSNSTPMAPTSVDSDADAQLAERLQRKLTNNNNLTKIMSGHLMRQDMKYLLKLQDSQFLTAALAEDLNHCIG